MGTVKTHVHNLCGKLGAPTRGRAVARARELGLLAPGAAPALDPRLNPPPAASTRPPGRINPPIHPSADQRRPVDA